MGTLLLLLLKMMLPNSSSGLDIVVVPYTNGTPATVGTDKTITSYSH